MCVLRKLLAIALSVCLLGCDEQILHDLSEREANKVLSRLSSEHVGATKVLQSDGRWAIAVSRDATVTALSYLDINRVLPLRASGVPAQAKSGFVPSREEQWFRYERSVATSLEESLGTVLGVLEARVHLNLPETDPLFGSRKENLGSGSVLLVIDGHYSSKDDEIAALVAGAAGIPAGKVTVLRSLAEAPVEPPDAAGTNMLIDAEINVHGAIHSADEVWKSFSKHQIRLTSAAAAAMLVAGVVLVVRRRRRVKFVLPGISELGV